MAVPDTLQLTTGYNYYDCFMQAGQIYDFTSAALVTAGTETRSRCDVPLTAISNTVDADNNQLFACGSPDGLPEGLWTRLTFRRVGGSPALTDPAKWVEEGYEWDGTQHVTGSGTTRSQTTTTRTIRFDYNVAGVATDVTTAVLSDPTGTFGMKRVDTGEIIEADATALTHDGTGTYSIEVPTEVGVTYIYWVEWVIGGVTDRRSKTFTETEPENDEDLITLTEIKTFLNLSSTTYDTLLAALITSASLALAKYCERDSFKSTVYADSIVNGNGKWFYTLPNTPVTALSSVIIDYGGWYPRTYAGTVFDYESTTGEFRFKRTALMPERFCGGFQNLSLSYTAGLSSIPEDLKLICKMVVKFYYQQTTINSALKSEKIGDYSYTNFQPLIKAGLDSDPALDNVRTLLVSGGYYKSHTFLF